MGERRRNNELQSVEDFRRSLEEEISVSSEFDLPLCALVLIVENEWEPEAAHSVRVTLRTADLIAQIGASELAVGLPNTIYSDAEKVGQRIANAAPEVDIGISAYDEGDSVESLLDRARRGATSPENT